MRRRRKVSRVHGSSMLSLRYRIGQAVTSRKLRFTCVASKFRVLSWHCWNRHAETQIAEIGSVY